MKPYSKNQIDDNIDFLMRKHQQKINNLVNIQKQKYEALKNDHKNFVYSQKKIIKNNIQYGDLKYPTLKELLEQETKQHDKIDEDIKDAQEIEKNNMITPNETNNDETNDNILDGSGCGCFNADKEYKYQTPKIVGGKSEMQINEDYINELNKKRIEDLKNPSNEDLTPIIDKERMNLIEHYNLENSRKEQKYINMEELISNQKHLSI